jgi:hypothetical protein
MVEQSGRRSTILHIDHIKLGVAEQGDSAEFEA